MARKYKRKTINKDLSGSSADIDVLPAMTDMSAQFVHRPIVVSTVPLKMPFKTTGIIVERRPSNGPPSAIKMRVNYNKETPPFRASAYVAATPSPVAAVANCKLTSTPLNGISRLNMSSGCANCSKYSGMNDSMLTNVSSHHSMMMAASGGSSNREEFLKYLGIDTKPTQEKTASPQTSPPDAQAAAAYNHRRSLRVFIQQKQNEYTRMSKSPEKSPSKSLKSPSRTQYNGAAATASASMTNINASPSESMKRGCALNNDLRMDSADLLLKSSTLSSSLPSLPLHANGMLKPISNLISTSHIKQRHSYDPASAAKSLLTLQTSTAMATSSETQPDAGAAAADVNNGARKPTNDASNSITNASEAPASTAPNNVIRQSTHDNSERAIKSPAPAAKAGRRDSLDRTRLLRSQKRKVILPSPMMLTEMFKRYKQCFRQGFAMQKQLRQQMKHIAKAPADTDALNPSPDTITDVQTTPATNEKQQSMFDAATSSAHMIDTPTHDLPDSLLSSMPVNSNNVCSAAPEAQPKTSTPAASLPPPPNVTLTASESIQWNRDLAKRADKLQFPCPLDPRHGAVLAILTHSVSPSEDDVVVVVQESQISYWYSTAKILCMFGIERKWIPVSSIPRVNIGDYSNFDLIPISNRLI